MRISDWSSDVCSSDLEMLDEAVAIAVVEVDDNFCVRARVEHMPARLEFGAQLDEVEDLAVEHRPHRACGVVDRLVSRSEEHTSELQSLMRNSYAVFCLKKKQRTHRQTCYAYIS